MKNIHFFFALILCGLQTPLFAQLYKDGDIIFIKNKAIKGKTLLPNGKSKFNFAGIIFIEKDGPTVYYADEPFAKRSLPEFVSLSENREFEIKNLGDEEMLTNKVITAMHNFALEKLGTNYDNKLSLNSDDLYNAEFIWKIYNNTLELSLSIPREIKDYKVENSLAIDFLKDAYGPEILKEKIVSIGDLYQSQFLE